MLRNIIIFLVVTAGSIYAWEPPIPFSLNISADEPLGYSNKIKVTVSVELKELSSLQNIEKGGLELEIFIPPAMNK